MRTSFGQIQVDLAFVVPKPQGLGIRKYKKVKKEKVRNKLGEQICAKTMLVDLAFVVLQIGTIFSRSVSIGICVLRCL